MIAIVDDEEGVRKAVVRVLEAAGFTARAFASGEEFLDTWHFDRPDCLVLDLQMPRLSGTDVLHSLRVAGAQFPTVIVTAHDSPSLREECRWCNDSFAHLLAVARPEVRLRPPGESGSVAFPWRDIDVCPIGLRRYAEVLQRPASARCCRRGKLRPLGFVVGSRG